MVENIYGRKTYPQSKYHERSFLQSHAFAIHHRRVSDEPQNLRTIAETDDDDLAGSENFSRLVSNHSDLGATGSSTRKPRAISLPTIYRDGSYLRINFPSQFNEGAGRRRFSEPAVSWCSKFRPAIVPVCNDKKLTNDRGPYLTGTQKICMRSEGVNLRQKIQIERRRHSDPLIYSSESIQKIENSGTDCQKNTQASKPRIGVRNSETSCIENIGQETDKCDSQRAEEVVSSNAPAAPTRRRKSSLVPIPFSIVKSCSSRKQKAPSKRRLSFPLSKNEEELSKNLPALHKQAWIDNGVEQRASPSESFTSLDLLIQKDSFGEMELAKEDYSEDRKHSCEEIITQWMKFFG